MGRSVLFGIFKSTLILALGAGGGIEVYRISASANTQPAASRPSTPSRSDGSDKVEALGSLQPMGGVVEVALPAGMLPTRFGEGIARDRSVKKGQVLAYLEGYEVRLREVEVIDAEIVAAKAALKVEDENEEIALAEIERECAQAIDLGKMEQESLKLKIEALNDKYLLGRKQLADVEGLQLNKTISGQEYDQLRTQEKISREELEYARAEARRSSRALGLNTDPAKVERQRQRARALAARARAQIAPETLEKKRALAVEMVERSKVLSPIDGQVLDLCTKAGESGAGKPLAKLGDTSRMYVLAEIYEDDRRRVREGQKVEVRGRGLPSVVGGPILGTVEEIHSIIGSHKLSPLDPTSRDNARVFPAWIALDLEAKDPKRRAALEELRRLVQMPVEVTILVGQAEPDGDSGRSGK